MRTKNAVKVRKEHQELLTRYIDVLAATDGRHQAQFGDLMQRVASAMRQIQIEMS